MAVDEIDEFNSGIPCCSGYPRSIHRKNPFVSKNNLCFEKESKRKGQKKALQLESFAVKPKEPLCARKVPDQCPGKSAKRLARRVKRDKVYIFMVRASVAWWGQGVNITRGF
jgi:hypothetical protein